MPEETYATTLAERILALDDIPSEVIHIKEWGCDVLVKGGTAADRYKLDKYYEKRAKNKENMGTIYADLAVQAARDPETGSLIFRPEQRDALLEKSGRACSRIAKTFMRLTGYIESESTVDDTAKNSEKVDD